MVNKTGARLSVLVYVDKDLLQLECERKRAKHQMKHWAYLMIVLFSNTSRMYFCWQWDRAVIMYTLTGDLNSEGWFQNDCHVPLHTIHLSHHLEESRHVGVSMTHCHLFGNIPYFGSSQPGSSRKAWNLHHLSVLSLQCSPLSTVTHRVVTLVCWVSLALIKSHFMTKWLFLKMLGSPFGHHLGLSDWTPENSQVRITLLASIQGQGEAPMLSGPADVPKRAVEPVFRATSSPQNRAAPRLKFKWTTCTYTFFSILSLLKIIHIYLQNSPPGLFFFFRFAKMDWRKGIWFLFSTLGIWRDLRPRYEILA